MSPTAESVCAEADPTEEVLAALRDRIGAQKYRAWFSHGTRVQVLGDRVEVAVPNPFVAHWVEGHYASEIAEAAQARTGEASRVVVTIDPSLSGQLRKRQLDTQAEIVSRAAGGRQRRGPKAPRRPSHRLDDFVVGGSNRLAYSAAVALAGAGQPPFNPLVVHGPCGVGKTHLLQGLCREAMDGDAHRAAVKCRYVTAEEFTNEFLYALRKKELDGFRGRYRRLELLAIDDVHFLAAKKATQDEFLHTFNAIAEAGRRVVLASDAHPRMVANLNEQLVSRFVSGMVVRIDFPEEATRLEILRRRAARMGFRGAPGVLEYVARQVRGSVRELEGALTKLAAMAKLQKGPATAETAAGALADHLARTDSAVTLGDIEAAVAAFFGITPADIHSSRRTRTVSAARMLTVYLARNHTQMSYPEIGRFIGKNHSSVVLGVKRMKGLLASGSELCWSTPGGKRSRPASEVVEVLSRQFT